MARRKNPENETEEQRKIRKVKEKIANGPKRSEKISWNRKMRNLEALYEEIKPIEDEILELLAKKQPIFDKMQEIREEMTNECIHPFDYLVVKDDYIICKFCNKRMKWLKNES